MMEFMNVDNFCKLLGVLLLMVAYTTFAHAAIYTFDCDNTFNCNTMTACSETNPEEGEDFGWEWVSYNFNSDEAGENQCEVTVETTGYGHPGQAQLSEVVEVYVNGTYLGTTSDDYGNVEDERFCGLATDTFTATADLREENELQLYIDDSVAIKSIELDCTLIESYVPPVDPCENNIAPAIDSFENELIDYTDSISYDLWNYIQDYDSEDTLSTLNISYSQSGTSVSCTFDGRELDCDAVFEGTTTITISATDSCANTTTESFEIEVNNSAPVLRLKETEVSCVQDLEEFIDITNYVWDEEVDSLIFEIYYQTAETDINCFIENGEYITCEAFTCNSTTNTVSVRATDTFGLYDEQEFDISIVNENPVWFENIRDTCINDDNSRIYDLRNYARDDEDGSNLNFSLTQDSTEIMDCEITNDYYISCTGLSNLNGSTNLTLTAEDSRGATAEETLTIYANCFENVKFSSDNMAVCMENFTTYAHPLELENISGEEQCYDFYTDFDIEGVEASLTPETVCVQPGEKRTLTLNINAYNSQPDDYEMSVISENQELEMQFEVGIGTCTNFDGFFVEEFDRTVCRGEKWELPVMVRNHSDEEKAIDIEADNSYLLPYFERDTVIVDDDSEEKVTLNLNAKYAPLGFYDIQLEGDAQNYHIAKNLELEVIDCSNIAERTFILETPGSCHEVNKGDVFENYFTVKRTRDTCSNPRDPEEINFKIFGMDYELSYNSKEIECFEEEVIDYAVFIDENEKAGTHFIKIRADDGQYEEFKEVCINVLGTGESDLLLLTSPKDVMQGTTEIFEIEVRNTGDFTEDFNLSASGMAEGITINFSEDNFTLDSGETKIIYAAVTANCDEPIGETGITVTLEGPETLTTEIRFTVTESSYSENIEFVSYTSDFPIKANSKGEYELMIRNNTNTTLTDLRVYVEGAPVDVNFEEIIIQEIEPGETVSVVGEVLAGDTNGYFTASYVVSSNNIKNKQEFTIFIAKNEDNGIFSGFFGLFGLNGSEGAESVGLALVLIILLIGIILVITHFHQPTQTNEKWVAGELDE